MADDERTKMARKILAKAEDAREQFIFTFELLEETRRSQHLSEDEQSQGLRGKKPASSLHSIRAMVVFAGAGMDSVVQQLLKDSLLHQVENNKAARGYFENLVGHLMAGKNVRDARKERDRGDHIDKQILKEALLYPTGSEAYFIGRILDETDSTSFQNASALEQAAGLLGLLRGNETTHEANQLKSFIRDLQSPDAEIGALKVRNKIVHDFDIDLTKAGGRGQSLEINRSREEMERYADQLLRVASQFIIAVEADPFEQSPAW